MHIILAQQNTVTQYLPYILLGIMAIFFIYHKVLPALKGAKQMAKSLKDVQLNKNAHLSKTQLQHILVGAMYSEQQTAFINSLETGLSSDHVGNILWQAWDIKTPKQAQNTLEDLLNRGHRFCFDDAIAIFGMDSENARNELLKDAESRYNEDDFMRLYTQVQNLMETWETLTDSSERVHISTHNDLKKYGNAAWDFGRVVMVARLCFETKLLSEEEAWSFIDRAYEAAAQHFNNWEELAKSFVIGRAAWGGEDAGIGATMYIGRYLLEKDISPWTHVPFK